MKMAKKKTFRVHFVVPAEEGALQSAGMELNVQGGRVHVGHPGHYRVACDPTLVFDELNMGTGEPWAVRCADCFATEVFKERWYPRPGSVEAEAAKTMAPEDRAYKPPCPSC